MSKLLQGYSGVTLQLSVRAHIGLVVASVSSLCGLADVTIAATADSGKAIDEVVVTARKVQEFLQDAPVSVSAISGAQLEKLGAADVKDVLGQIPGLSFSNVERGQGKYTIHGISSSTAAPTVGVYLNDISLVTDASFREGAFDVVFFDIDRVEVLKGPQGTLYGGSAMGGAIKYVTAKPALSEFSSSVAAGAGTVAHGDMSYNTEGILNLPLFPGTLAMRVGFYYLHEGGFIDNIAGLDIEKRKISTTPYPTYTPQRTSSLSTVSEEDYNYSDTYAGRLSVLWQPDSSLSIQPAVFYQESTLENPAYFNSIEGDRLVSSYRFLNQETPDRGVVYSLDVIKEWGNVELTSLTSYFNRKQGWNRDYSFYIGSLVDSLYAFNSFTVNVLDNNTFGQELRIASVPASDSRLSWLVGLYYSDQDVDDFNEITTLGLGLPDDISYAQYYSRELVQRAAFGEATFQLTDALDLTAGVRLFDIEQVTSGMNRGIFARAGGAPAYLYLTSKESGVNPKLGVSYKLNDDHLLFTSVAKGFRPGGPTGVIPVGCETELVRLGFSGLPEKYDSDELWTYEIGSKNELGGGRMIVNASLFYSDWKDVQQNVRLTTCGGNFPANAGDAEVKGAEIEARFNPTPRLQVGANVAYTDAKIVEIDPGFGTGAKNGDTILDTPEWTAGVSGNYSLPLTAVWDLQVSADYQYRGSQRRQFDSTQVVTFPGNVSGTIPYDAVFQDSYDVANASVSVNNGISTVRLYVSNAFDDRPLIDTNYAVGISRSTTIRPRTVGVEVRHQF